MSFKLIFHPWERAIPVWAFHRPKRIRALPISVPVTGWQRMGSLGCHARNSVSSFTLGYGELGKIGTMNNDRLHYPPQPRFFFLSFSSFSFPFSRSSFISSIHQLFSTGLDLSFFSIRRAGPHFLTILFPVHSFYIIFQGSNQDETQQCISSKSDRGVGNGKRGNK